MKNSILLNSELLKIGNDFMINYKEDIEVDVKHLLADMKDGELVISERKDADK